MEETFENMLLKGALGLMDLGSIISLESQRSPLVFLPQVPISMHMPCGLTAFLYLWFKNHLQNFSPMWIP